MQITPPHSQHKCTAKTFSNKQVSHYKQTALAIIVLSLLGSPGVSLSGQTFDLNTGDYSDKIINKKYLYLIPTKTSDLSANSLKLNGNEWDSGDITSIRLISINTDNRSNSGDLGGDGSRLPIDSATIYANSSNISNVTNLTEFNQIYITAANNTTIDNNQVTVTNSLMGYFRPIYITEISSRTTVEGTTPAVGSDNLTISRNIISTDNLSTQSGFVGILVQNAKNLIITCNTIDISDGTHNKITGISASRPPSNQGLNTFSDNTIIVSDATFKELHGVEESLGENSGNIIKNNTLRLFGSNTLLDRSNERLIVAVDSTSSIEASKLIINGSLDIQNKSYTTTIYSGYSRYGNVDCSDLIVDNANIQRVSDRAVEVIAGYANQASTNNRLQWSNGSQISGIDSRSNSSYLIAGRSLNSVANYNSVEISDSTWKADNFSMQRPSDYDNVLNPTKKLSGSAIVGGWGEAESRNNKISIKDSTIKAKNIIGSISNSGNMSSEILIENSAIEGSVQLFYSGDSAIGSDSTLTIRGSHTDLSNARLVTTTSATVQTSNNRLVFDGWNGTVRGLGAVLDNGQKMAFDHLSFKNMEWQNGGTILTSTALESYGGGSYTVVNPDSITDGSLQFIQGPAMEADESMTIIYADNGITYTDDSVLNTNKTVKGNSGTALEFEGTLTFGENDLTYEVEAINNASQTILVGDSRLAAAAFINQGSDLLERVFHGFTLSRDKYGLMTFATAEGSKTNYDLSSPIKVNGWNFLGGVRYVAPTAYGDLTTALFVEYGDGNYRTGNSHLGLNFRTDGSVQYIGGGLAMRLMTPTNFYAEGSLRAGELQSDLNRALMDANGNSYDTDTTSLYAGLHLGAGYIYKPRANFELDSYAKYFFTYTDSDSFSIDRYNETYEFKSIDSHRLRLGTRLSSTQNNLTFMFGLAGEYEFAAESDMIVTNAATQSSDLGGFSAFAEAGLSIRPSNSSPWQFDAQVRGWTGTREAITGMATVNYFF